MDRLISYRPELELAPTGGAAWRDDSLSLAADLLSARRAGRLQPMLRQLAPGLETVLAPLAAKVLSAGPAAGRMLGMELEGLSGEDREFETARQFMRFAGLAARRARQAARGDPRQVRRAALALAARQHAPGLMPAIVSILERQAAALPSAVLPEREHIMHDIDRTTLEFGNETSNYEGEYEFGEAEWGGEMGQQGMLTEAEEMELASELLSVTNEAELEQFLGGFLKKAASFAGNVIRSPIGQAIGGALKGVAKKALPLAGGAIGGYFGGPLGAKIGSGLASAAGSALGLEAEGEIHGEDREFEGARTFVKLAADTVSRAAQARGGDPRQIAMQAATAAARQYAPGLLGRAAQQGGFGGAMGGAMSGACRQQGGGMQGQGTSRGISGRWVRQGRKIVLYGA